MFTTCVSRRPRFAAVARPRTAVCRATPWSQLATARSGTSAALRTRTRKVAWNASSASWRLGRIRRQTPQTIGACRRTRAARASPSRLPRKGARSSPSTIAPTPGATSARKCWMTPLNGLVGIDFHLAAIISTSLSSERAVLIHQFDDEHGVVQHAGRGGGTAGQVAGLFLGPQKAPQRGLDFLGRRQDLLLVGGDQL